MKIKYKFTTETVEIEVVEDWGNRILEFNRSDYNSERKDHRADHKYHRGTPITVDDAESIEYSGLKKQRGQVQTNTLLDNFIQNEENDRLHTAIKKLPETQQKVITAVFFGGLKPVEYARLNGISRSAVSQQMTNALNNLKKLLS